MTDPLRLQAHIGALTAGLLQRDTAARLLLLAALAGEHVLLIGPPGTAKSELARRLHRAFADAPYFERLLTRFSTPEELFGPLSLKALEEDRYERQVQGFLPTAGIAFLDEVFKASSAILNALLTLLHERAYDNGTARLPTPLVSVVAASNEGPADESLAAFFDRFLLRVPVAPVDDEAFAALLAMDDTVVAAPEPISAGERAALTGRAGHVVLGADALQGCTALRTHLAAQGLVVSDRRWRQWVGLMRVAAASEGRATIDTLDLWLTPFVAAGTAAQAEALAQWFEAELLGAVPQEAPWLTRAVEAFETQLQLEQTAPADAHDDGGAGKLAVARALGGTGDAGAAMPRLVSDRLLRRWSPVHIAARLAQLDELLAGAHSHAEDVQAHAQTLATALAGRLWIPPALARRWLDAHAQTLATLQALCDRALQCRAGYAALPVDDTLPAVVPTPVEARAA